jgi:hypothetical protein
MTLPYFCIFVIISPLKRTWPFIWTIENSLYPKEDLYQVWLKLACWSWRRSFLKVFSILLFFCYYLPLEKDKPLHLYTFESPPRWLVPSLVKIPPVVLSREEVEDVKVHRQTDGRRAIRKAHLSFQLRWAKQFVYFYYFAVISPWVGALSFIWTILNPLPKGDLC